MCNSLMLILTGKRECKIFKQNIDRNVFTLQIADHFTAVQCSDHYTDLSCCSCPRVFPWPGCSVRQRPAGAGQRHLRRGGQPWHWLTLRLELQQGRRETGHATVTNKVRYFEFLGKNNFEILWNSSRLVLMSKWKRLGFEDFICCLYVSVFCISSIIYISRVNGTRSILDYVPRTEMDYGSVLCWATNTVGRQSEPCVYHIIPAGKSHSPLHTQRVFI